jgi:signal transduction histidine kinase
MSIFPPERRMAICGKDPLTPARVDSNLGSETAFGRLAMSIVHDLRNPLTAIHAGAEILNGAYLPEQEVRRLARNIYTASVRIQQLLHDYVDLCRTGEKGPHPFNLRRLIAEAVERIAAKAKAQAVVVVHNVPAELVVTLNRHRIASVLVNLLDNALDVMPAGGSIHISTLMAENSVVLKVLDTGPGIAPEIRGRLFEPFVTARKPNGWGLGLAQARQAVLEHGGEIWLEDPPGPGACFAFRLPLYRSREREFPDEAAWCE